VSSVKRFRPWLVTACLGVVLGAGAGGCGDPLSSLAGFCDAFGNQLCVQLQDCPLVPQPVMGDCKQSLSGQVCYCAMNAIANGTEKYHPEKAQACLDAVKRLSCSTVSESANPPECSLVYGLAAGAAPQCPIVIGPLPDGGSTD
jgi:hypothetical protein